MFATDPAGHHLAIMPTVPTAAGGSFVNFEGDSVSGTISITAHTWTDDASGLFHTATDLNAEWTGFYQQMIEGHGASMTPEQRLEAQGQAIFLNTGLGKLPMAQQGVIREDVQREIDVLGAAQRIEQAQGSAGPAAPFTEQSYYQLARTIQANPQLEELAVQGHGLNHPPLARYAGYTNDAQNNVDKTTTYVGRGPDHGENAIAGFMDDAIMSHACFPVVMRNGHLIQLNQNGQREQSLAAQVNVLNMTMFGKLLNASDFKS